MLIKAYNTPDRSQNLLTHTLPAKRVMVINGQIQPGFEDAVAAILAQSGMQLMPEHRRGKSVDVPKPHIVRAKRVKSGDIEVVVIPATDTEPEECIPLHQILEAEQVLNDSYEEDARRYDRPDREVMGRKAA